MGVTLQLWENSDQKGWSILINLPLVKALHNVMPIQLHRDYESYSTACVCVDVSEMEVVSLGTNPSLLEVPRFMNRVIETLQIWENELEKPRPDGLSKDLILESSISVPFITEVMKHMWFTSVKEGDKMFSM